MLVQRRAERCRDREVLIEAPAVYYRITSVRGSGALQIRSPPVRLRREEVRLFVGAGRESG